MKRIFITLITVIVSSFCLGQKFDPPQNVEKRTFGLTPATEHTIINGMAFGLSAHPWSTWNDTLFVKINGLNIELGLLGIVGGLWGTTYGFASVLKKDSSVVGFFSSDGYSDSLDTVNPKYGTHLNGVSISLGGVSETYNKGLIINGLSGFCYKISGIQVSGLINETYESKGLLVAGIANITNRGHGIQIGLINNCKTGNILQIGLWNRIGKRALPFLNLRISKTGKEHKSRSRSLKE